MTLPWNGTLVRVVQEAEHMAQSGRAVFGSFHLLLVLCQAGGRAAQSLRAQSIDSLALNQVGRYTGEYGESEGIIDDLLRRAGVIAEIQQSAEVSDLHLLQAICLEKTSQAQEMLRLAGFKRQSLQVELDFPGFEGEETLSRDHGVQRRSEFSEQGARGFFRTAPTRVQKVYQDLSSTEHEGCSEEGSGRQFKPQSGGVRGASNATGRPRARWRSNSGEHTAFEPPAEYFDRPPEVREKAPLFPKYPLEEPYPPASRSWVPPQRSRDWRGASQGSDPVSWSTREWEEPQENWSSNDTAEFRSFHDTVDQNVIDFPPPHKPRVNSPRSTVSSIPSTISQKPQISLPHKFQQDRERARSPLGRASLTKSDVGKSLTRERIKSTPSEGKKGSEKSASLRSFGGSSIGRKSLAGLVPNTTIKRSSRRSVKSEKGGVIASKGSILKSVKKDPSPIMRSSMSPSSRSGFKARSKPSPHGKRKAQESRVKSVRESQERASQSLSERLFGNSSERPKAIKKSPDDFLLDAKHYPTLARFGRNLLEEAREGRFDEVVGREGEINQLIDTLNKRRSNNPVLLGEAGVGKTAIVEGLALRMISDRAPESLGDRVIIALEFGTLLSGTQLRGALQERISAVKKEVRASKGKIILFLDELHTWLGGNNNDNNDASGELKIALARGELPCIGATTPQEFKRFIEADPAFKRRFDTILVKAPNVEESIEILQGVIGKYAAHHSVVFTRDAINAAVKLSDRFIPEHELPDKAFNVIDRAGASAQRLKLKEVTREQIARVISVMSSVPVERLLLEDRERFLRMEEHLSANLIGHTHVIERIARVIRRNYAGFASDRPIGSFLFLGPTGVGKTETVKVLANFMFGSSDAIVRLDMSEFMEKHAVARLIGAPPGYVGHKDGGQLTEALRRRPYQIVLLDEIEKAHPDVLNILLQVLDAGRLSDGQGRTVNFSNALIVMTSNLGSSHFSEARRGCIGFSGREESSSSVAGLTDSVLDTAKGRFPLELWNRIEERVVFQPLKQDEIAKIAMLQLRDSARRLESDRGIILTFGDGVIAYLIANGGFDPALGARPMRQVIQRLIEAAVAEAILKNGFEKGSTLAVKVMDGEIHVADVV